MALSKHLEDVQKAIDYRFTDPDLLETALTHSSFASENEVESYERLEFLGDAVLELAVTERIFELLGHASEGHMTRTRGSVVDEASLASVARVHGLVAAIRLGVGEDRNGGRARSSIQSDVVEAIFGAVYVDGGAASAFGVVNHLLADTVADRVATPTNADPRSGLQEQLAQVGKTVDFEYQRSGPDHAVTYSATASVDGTVIGTGSGASKKSAAIDAARSALKDHLSS